MRRLRRLRREMVIRDLVSETQLRAADLILPYFVVEGKNKRETIASMPGICRLSIDNLIQDVREAKEIGIKAVLLFGVSHKKDEKASESYRKDGIVQLAIEAIKKKMKNVIIISDVCLCGYTSHGHCGVVGKNSKFLLHRQAGEIRNSNFKIDNDATIRILAKIALSHAQAGADFVAPSGMMDGQVKAIREVLDKNEFKDVGVLAYSAKYASNFYGPFRDVLDSSPKFGDRKSYQLDFRNSDEALREIEQDIREGADMVMVKPALAYLDIIYRAKQKFNIPLAAYNVSGEYSLIKGGAKYGLTDEKNLVLEVLTSIKRAGADLIITYWAKDAAKWLK